MMTDKKDPKPRATIEGKVKDITPARDRSAAPGSDGEKTTTSTGDKKPDAAESRKPEKPAQAGRGSVVRRLSRYLVAGVAGSLATLAILAVALILWSGPQSWLADLSGAGAARRLAQTSAMESEARAEKLVAAIARQDSTITALQTALAETSKRLETTDDLSGQLTSLSDRVAGRLDGLREMPARTTALELRLKAAATRLDALAKSDTARTRTVDSLARALDEAAKAGTSTAAVSTGLARSLSRLDAAEAGIAELTRRLENYAKKPDASQSWRDDANEKISVLTQQVAALAARAAEKSRLAEVASADSQVAALTSAIETGKPFADLLTPFESYPASSDLRKFAANGAPTRESLVAGLTELAQSAPIPVSQDDAISRIAGWFGGAIKIRRTGGAALSDASFSAAVTALNAGDLTGAIDIVSQAEQNPSIENWLASAQVQSQIIQALASLSAAVGANVSGTGE